MTPHEIVKHCWTCRRETVHRHVQQISSRTLYACTTVGCTAPHREVTDPSMIGRSQAAIEDDSARRQPGQATAPVTRTLEDVDPSVKTQRLRLVAPKQETKPIMAKTEFKNPLHQLINAAVTEQLKDLVTKEEFDDLADRVKQSATPKELDQHVGRILEKQLPELINAALLQLLAAPKKATTATRGAKSKDHGLQLSGPCPRQPHKGKCPGAWCINAQKKAAAAAESSDD